MGERSAQMGITGGSKWWRRGYRAIGIMLIPILSFALLAAINEYTVPDKSAPAAKRGVVDLSGWPFGPMRTVLLDGEWSFYPKKLYEPADFEAGRVPAPSGPYASIPNAWYGGSPADEASGTAYGTYRLTVKVKEEDVGYGIRLPNVNGAHKLYVNGHLVGGQGVVADNGRDYVKDNKPYLTFVRPEGGRLDIVLQSANLEEPMLWGGFEDVQLGLQTDMLLIERIHFAIEFSGVFILLLFAGYHMTIYVLRTKDRAYLYSSLYFLTMLILMATGGEKLTLQLLPGLSYGTLTKLYDLGGFLNIVLLGGFLHTLDGKLLSRKQLLIGVSPILVYLTAVVLLPYPDYRLLGNMPWYYATFLVAFYLCRAIRLFAKRDGRLLRQESLLLVGVLVSIALILLFGMLYSLSLVQTEIGRRISFLSVLAFMNALLALRLANATDRTEQLTEQLVKRDKLKDEFLANTSHELKTPLHGIQNISSFLLEEKAGTLTERQRSELSLIQDTSTKLSALVNDLLDVVRLKHGDLRLQEMALDARVAAQTAFQVLEFELAGKDVRWENEIPPDTFVLADENRLRQILYNLIHNAIKHTKSGRISAGAATAGAQTTLWIEDTGVGIPEESHEAIFGYFEQADREIPQDGYTGMGLGLYISRQLAERMGGRIRVDRSAPGQGTRIAFTLPSAEPAGWMSAEPYVAAASENGSRSRATELEAVGEGRPHTVLVVDDEASNVRILLNLLGDEYNVLTAFSAKEALRKLELDPRIDLLILDVMMPEMSGIDLCRAVREQRSVLELPILFATAKDSLHDIELCFRAGGNDFIAKPFDQKTLAARVRTLLAMKTSMDQAVENEMAFLQAQIKPHFIYNAISSIVSFCYTDSDRAAYLLTMLSRYLRMVFDRDGRTPQVPLRQELDLIRAYVEIEKARFGDRLVYRLQAEPELEDYYVPSLAIQPFVENAIRHGLFEKEGIGTVTLTVSDGDGYLRIDIDDDGVGMPDDLLYRLRSGERPEKAGIGMTNARKRLSALPGASIAIESELERGTKIVIYLPKLGG
ncbi:ATP-binding protein [Cohnella thailandensis]|uniref:histidine kinase n=1 Tax=Cohnella thailandensis TaxID=557557 RepID=A0A841SX18_9BACL|nr:ATP-binding protein [Cohnella thailandensis]MBB6635802.1 response regulator [Cohnella thailandensis]MBP1976180.1 signal transduction histidine kinase [Cohnella thailandensis]